jgi:hypothetical protein
MKTRVVNPSEYRKIVISSLDFLRDSLWWNPEIGWVPVSNLTE